MCQRSFSLSIISKVFFKLLQDFEKFGVFDAQSALEKVHKEEEDELYRQMFEERKAQMTVLESEILQEKKRTVRDLVKWFDTNQTAQKEREVGLTKVCAIVYMCYRYNI